LNSVELDQFKQETYIGGKIFQEAERLRLAQRKNPGEAV
jgi:hypothetical protein